jgi:hypothetical protein
MPTCVPGVLPLVQKTLQAKAFGVERRTPRINPNLRLPCRLADLPPHTHAHVGRLLDDRRVRYLRDDDGSVLVAWSARA